VSSEDRRSEADALGTTHVSSSDGFTVEVQRPSPSVVLLRVEGELDLWTSLPLLDAILTAFGERPDLIAVDLSAVRSMDHTGLRMLVEASGHVVDVGVRCALICRGGSEVARFLECAAASATLELHMSVDDALRPRLGEAGELPAGV
jgi:anti-anti-sigma factor